MSSPSIQSLQVTDLCLTLGNRLLLDHMHFTTAYTGTTMVMGPNGAGKSLLLRCLHGLLTPEHGQIDFCGHAMSTLRHRQAMVFQKAVLLRRTARANLEFAAKDRGVTRDTIDQMLTRVHLLDKAEQPARLLSGGEQQRLALARALLTDPQILFLDEPTASLDPASVLIIEQLIQEANAAGVKTLFISHDLGQARRLADDVVFVHRGQIAEHTDASTFFTNPQSKAATAYLDGELVL